MVLGSMINPTRQMADVEGVMVSTVLAWSTQSIKVQALWSRGPRHADQPNSSNSRSMVSVKSVLPIKLRLCGPEQYSQPNVLKTVINPTCRASQEISHLKGVLVSAVLDRTMNDPTSRFSAKITGVKRVVVSTILPEVKSLLKSGDRVELVQSIKIQLRRRILQILCEDISIERFCH